MWGTLYLCFATSIFEYVMHFKSRQLDTKTFSFIAQLCIYMRLLNLFIKLVNMQKCIYWKKDMYVQKTRTDFLVNEDNASLSWYSFTGRLLADIWPLLWNLVTVDTYRLICMSFLLKTFILDETILQRLDTDRVYIRHFKGYAIHLSPLMFYCTWVDGRVLWYDCNQ